MAEGTTSVTAICKFTIIRWLSAGLKGSHTYVRGYRDALATVPYEVLVEMYSKKGVHRPKGDDLPQRHVEPVHNDPWRQRT